MGVRRAAVRSESQKPAAYRDFTASELYCPKCRRAMPVREKLLLILPSGELYDFICTGCGSSLGSKTT
jgi:hypothetical protein